jgi:DNA invertase Pin-like site-specific DNA recombinase
MGRLTLNVLLSFAQFEREVIGERIRDKIAASKRKGMWMGGVPPLGYRVRDRKLVIIDRRQKSCARSFAAMPNSARFGCCGTHSTPEGSKASRGRAPRAA